ncbi:MAG: PaaI family thioesterase [Bacteroidia bacterium]
MESIYFQDHMPGNICFGCGTGNPEGLQIHSCWEGDEAVCRWAPTARYQGWRGILNGGILATLIDCHCMGSAMAAAYRAEGRALGSLPHYRYATGTLTVRYLLPTSGTAPVELRATIREIKGRKTTLHCRVFSEGRQTAEAEVIAIRVADSSLDHGDNPFAGR